MGRTLPERPRSIPTGGNRVRVDRHRIRIACEVPLMASTGIFCLEGDWGSSLTDRTSVRLGLDMLMTVRRGRLIHRNAATKQEFAHYMDRWSLQQYREFPVAYFSYHGDRGVLSLGKDD